jgi:glutathione S-transferase
MPHLVDTLHHDLKRAMRRAMPDDCRIFGVELSPYSVKVRSYFRYKRIPHTWVVRSMAVMEEFRRYAKLPLVPLVVAPDGTAMQDSTPIIEAMEKRAPEPALDPVDPTLRFLSALLEEYADEWGNKPMFHYRWTYEADQRSAADRIARESMPDAADADVAGLADAIRARMVPRLSFVGSSDATRAQIEGSFTREVDLLERHLATRPFVLGGRPALADLGLYAQLYQCLSDPTPGAYLRKSAPRVTAWIERMLDPKGDGPFESWSALAPTLEPLLAAEVADLFLPWSDANAKALAAEGPEKPFTVELEGRPFTQQTQKYHARSLGVLRQRYAAVSDRAALDPILERTGCRRWLAA